MYKHRIKIFMAVIAATLAVVLVRLWQLQIIEGADYRVRASEALRTYQPTSTRRGAIVDRDGEGLAVDRPCYEFCLDFGFLSGDVQWAQRQQRRIAKAKGVSLAQAERIYDERAANTWALACQVGGVSMEDIQVSADAIVRRVNRIHEIVGTDVQEERESHPVLSGLDDRAAAALKSRLDQMVGASVRPGFARYYPHAELLCHVVGVTGQITGPEQNKLNLPAGADRVARIVSDYLDGDIIGKNGVELLCEQTLRGQRGYLLVKRRPVGVEVLESHASIPGGVVRLSVDHVLQQKLTELFLTMTSRANALEGSRTGDKPSNGAIVVLKISTREVLAMVSLPVYNPNTFSRDCGRIWADRDLPWLNRAVGRLYPLGSTAKPVSALAALCTDKPGARISVDRQFTCTGSLRVGNMFLHCLGQHGSISVIEALQHSCNIYFYNVGGILGLEEISRWFARFGFAEPSGTGLLEEKAGSVPTSEWLARRMPGYRPAVPIDAMQVAIGQGFLEGTPMHVANVMATIASGGRFSHPVLILDGGPEGEPEQRDLGLRVEALQAVVEGMHRVVNEFGGTAYKYFHNEGEPIGADVYGKTGTATASLADLNGDGEMDDYEKLHREMAWFSGFAVGGSAGQPLAQRDGIAIAVVVENVPGGGGKNSAPIAREAIRICKEMGYIP